MKVTVSHQDAMKFECQTEKSSFVIDCPTISPLEYFLSGLLTCTATDIVMMPKSQGFEVKNLQVEGDAEKSEGVPKKFNTLHIRYSFDADADETTAARWVMASLESYCTTVNTVRDAVKISYTIVYNGNTIRENEQMISGGGGDYDMGEIGGCGA